MTTCPSTLPLRCPIDFSSEKFLMFVLDKMAYEYEKTHDDVIRLTLGKSELPPHPEIIEAMVEASRTFAKSTLVFPAGLPQLRERLAAHESERHGKPVRPDNVIVSVGTSTMFRNLFALLTRADDEVLLPLPYYPLYRFSAMLAGATVRYYRIDPDTMRLDVKSLRSQINERTRVVVVNSPGNPLGNVLTKEELLEIDRAVDGRAAIISDEIYANACFDGDAPSLAALPETRSPVIVTNAFSKGYRMYARRVGYAVVPDSLIEPLTVIQHHTLLTTDPIPQFGALAALARPQDVAELTASYRARRDYTVRKFAEVADVTALPAQGSFYFTLDCAAFMRRHKLASSLDLASEIMQSKHVATVPGSDFGLPQTLRLSYTSARYEEGIDRLVSFFSA
ncbi:MAG: aminotransferase class I/II-fold pyridoxal phosphate-dependent enzyme [Myxococcales bacterium]|nr:aminotransferase class I/II-fold pyridoxal phosphate-dependent enzyme [Myxococcales bacterium]HRC54401.1 aminotransferase class I/II-fold pyridoxal phosphate-dependent enzyme [Kofleriaceae bacterium]